MLAERTFRVVLVNKAHGTGIAETAAVDKTVKYSGEKTSATF
jgi:hypothetical protein